MAGTNGRLTEFPIIYDGSGRPFDLAALRADRNARQMNDGDGRWMDGTSGTDERYDGMDMPHPFTFAALYRGASHTYLHQWDEAMKHNRINALAMRRDCWLMSLLYERVDDTLSKRWHLEVDNPRDPWQKSVADGITKILKRTPHLKRLFRYMLHGSLWYGRYGANLKWVWDEMYVPVMQRSGPISPGVVSEPQFAKQRIIRIQKHKPVNGDKVGFHHDDTPYVMLNAGWSDHLRGRPDIIYPTGAGAAALLLRGTWREQVFIAESDPDDSDFFEAEMAAGVHGVGIRSRIYWLDFMRRDYISWVTDSMERLGLGLVVIWYDASNADAKKEAFTVAKTYSRRAAICMPRSPDSSWQGGGIEVVEAPTAGAEIVLQLQKHIEEQIERYIIGQTMSSGADNDSGLGGTGRSDFAADTKRKRCMFDADDFASSMTGSDVEPAPISTIKKWVYPFCDFPVWMVFDHEHDDPSKKMEAIKTCVDMGVSFPENRIRELTGIPAPEEGDEIIGGKQALALEQAANMATGGVIGGGGEQGGLESGAPDELGDEFPPEFEGGWKGSHDGPMVYYADTHWVTLGGHAEGGEKHKGGFPVKLDAEGNIVSSGGPSELIGKHVSEVKATFRKITPKDARMMEQWKQEAADKREQMGLPRDMTKEHQAKPKEEPSLEEAPQIAPAGEQQELPIPSDFEVVKEGKKFFVKHQGQSFGPYSTNKAARAAAGQMGLWRQEAADKREQMGLPRDMTKPTDKFSVTYENGDLFNVIERQENGVKYEQSYQEVDEQLYAEIEAMIPKEKPASLPCEVGMVRHWKICFVDGEKVMLDHDMDFTQANNYQESKYIPENEIWIDACTEPKNWCPNTYHECHETRDMEGGMSYEQAHERANAGEKIIRERRTVPNGTVEPYALDLKGDHDQQFLQLAALINRIRNQGVGRELLPKLKDFLRRYPDMARRLSASDLAFVNTRE